MTLRPASAGCTPSQLNTLEISVLLQTRLSGESPAVLFMCDRRPPEKVWGPFCGDFHVAAHRICSSVNDTTPDGLIGLCGVLHWFYFSIFHSSRMKWESSWETGGH